MNKLLQLMINKRCEQLLVLAVRYNWSYKSYSTDFPFKYLRKYVSKEHYHSQYFWTIRPIVWRENIDPIVIRNTLCSIGFQPYFSIQVFQQNFSTGILNSKFEWKGLYVFPKEEDGRTLVNSLFYDFKNSLVNFFLLENRLGFGLPFFVWFVCWDFIFWEVCLCLDFLVNTSCLGIKEKYLIQFDFLS